MQAIGAIHAGMTLDEAAAVAGTSVDDATPSAECRYVTFPKLPEGVAFMVIADTVRRVDIRTDDIATDAGARVGDPTSRILDLYNSGLETMPHKYTPTGQYLIASSPDSLYRLVFETAADTVRLIRAGRIPQVLWVEGCG